MIQAGNAVVHESRFVRSKAPGRHREQERKLRLAAETAANVRFGNGPLLDTERAVGVASQLFDRQALVARTKRRSQDFVFHRITAAFSFRLALTMYALAPLALVKPSDVVIASSRMSWP